MEDPEDLDVETEDGETQLQPWELITNFIKGSS